MVRSSHQCSTVGENKPKASKGRHTGEEMEVDWTHPKEAPDKHHPTGFDLESTRKTQERKTKDDMEAIGTSGNGKGGDIMETAGEGCTGQASLEECC